jgi:hypothetical protein
MAINSKTNRSPPTGAPWELTAEDWNTLWDQVQMARGENYGTVQDNSTVLSTGSITARTLADRFADVVNVVDFGADPTGVGDSTAAVQAAVDHAIRRLGGGAIGYCGTVRFPAGDYLLSSSITALNCRGLRLLGDGVDCTTITASAALSGEPVFLFTDCRSCHVESMKFYGVNGSPPSCAIQFDTVATRPNGQTPMYCVVRDVCIGGSQASQFTNGIRMSNSDGAKDANNDQHLVENVEFNNIINYGVSIEHSNSLLHDIIHCSFNSIAGAAVYCGGTGTTPGGSFRMFGGAVLASAMVAKLEGNAYYNPITFQSVCCESCPKFLSADGGFAIYVRDCSFAGTTTAGTDLVFEYSGTTSPYSGIFTIDGGVYFGSNGFTIDTSGSASNRTITTFTNVASNCVNVKFTGQLVVGPNIKGSATAFTKNDAANDKIISLGGTSTVASQNGTNFQTLPNNVGVFEISDTDTSVSVTLPFAEPNNSYYVLATPHIATAGTAAEAFTIKGFTNQAASSFTANILGAPGTGKTVTFIYKIVRLDL